MQNMLLRSTLSLPTLQSQIVHEEIFFVCVCWVEGLSEIVVVYIYTEKLFGISQQHLPRVSVKVRRSSSESDDLMSVLRA